VIYLLLAGRVLLFLAGLALVGATLGSSVRTVILPRASVSVITRMIFLIARQVYDIRIGRRASFERRDAILASYAPITLLLLLATWIALILIGFQLMFVAIGNGPFQAFQISGSSVLTLGFSAPRDLPNTLLVLLEGLIGLTELALLISYLPAMYAAFQRREAFVNKLEVRAGSPPSGVVMLERFQRLHGLEHLSLEVWEQWEDWFIDLEETHTSLPVLAFFRSPRPDRSWITAAGAVLDGAALYASALHGRDGHDSHADLCLRAGYLALRAICEYFQIPFNASPQRGDPISITRSEYDGACERLRASGLPVRGDRDTAWEDFAGWRVNYDEPLLLLAGLVSAPYATWSSDRGSLRRPNLFRLLLGLQAGRRST